MSYRRSSVLPSSLANLYETAIPFVPRVGLRVACLVPLLGVRAQTAPAPSSPPVADEKIDAKKKPAPTAAAVENGTADKAAVVTLSPFEVNSAKDQGYAATSSLSGTRLNSKLEDLAASLSVVTKQQLEDTASTDINDVFIYEVNTEGTAQLTNFSVDRGNVSDGVQNDPQGSNRMRGLTPANIASNGFITTLPFDTYNTERWKFPAGPIRRFLASATPVAASTPSPRRRIPRGNISSVLHPRRQLRRLSRNVRPQSPAVEGPARPAGARPLRGKRLCAQTVQGHHASS